MLLSVGKIDARFSWFNPPAAIEIKNDRLHVRTAPNTDFWQGTHYGFRRDDGHCLLTSVTSDFSMTVRTAFLPQQQYDQCGLMVRGDQGHWIKVSTEYEDPKHSRLGSVVTNMGWSDWATTDVGSDVTSRWYRIRSQRASGMKDFLIEASEDGNNWRQLRIAHMQGDFNKLAVGIYACSPMPNGGFEATFERFSLGNSTWG